jgi:hypothetical protein
VSKVEQINPVIIKNENQGQDLTSPHKKTLGVGMLSRIQKQIQLIQVDNLRSIVDLALFLVHPAVYFWTVPHLISLGSAPCLVLHSTG